MRKLNTIMSELINPNGGPIKYRNSETTFCCHCHLTQKTLHGMEYFHHSACCQNFDDSMCAMENTYFNEKYMYCPECGNIAEDLEHEDNTPYFNTKEIRDISNSNKPQIEKNFLIMHKIHNTYQTLLDIYRYYQYTNNEEEARPYRNQIISKLEEDYQNHHYLHTLRLLIEYHRRNGDFDKALDLIKNEFGKKKYAKFVDDYSYNGYGLYTRNIYIIKEEKKLCKKKNSNRIIWKRNKNDKYYWIKHPIQINNKQGHTVYM